MRKAVQTIVFTAAVMLSAVCRAQSISHFNAMTSFTVTRMACRTSAVNYSAMCTLEKAAAVWGGGHVEEGWESRSLTDGKYEVNYIGPELDSAEYVIYRVTSKDDFSGLGVKTRYSIEVIGNTDGCVLSVPEGVNAKHVAGSTLHIIHKEDFNPKKTENMKYDDVQKLNECSLTAYDFRKKP